MWQIHRQLNFNSQTETIATFHSMRFSNPEKISDEVTDGSPELVGSNSSDPHCRELASVIGTKSDGIMVPLGMTRQNIPTGNWFKICTSDAGAQLEYNEFTAKVKCLLIFCHV